MGAGWINPTQEILLCHYDVKPYRDAFHGRNSPCYLLCSSFVILLITTVLSVLILNGSQSDSSLPDHFLNDITALFNLNRTTILKDTKAMYPLDLELSVSPTHITSNQPFPICIAAPQFLFPLLQSPSLEDIHNEEPITSINDIKKAHHNIKDDLFKEPKDWLKAPSFFTDPPPNEQDDPYSSIGMDEIWQSILGYALDPKCFIRIDQSSTKIIKQLESAKVDPSTHHDIICSNQGRSVMQPSFFVINPDNGVIYQSNIGEMYYGGGKCVSYQNTFHYDKLDKHKFDALLSEERDVIEQFFADMNHYVTYALIIVILVVGAVYIGMIGYFLLSMWLEGLIVSIVIWILMLVLKRGGVLHEFGNIAPTFKEIWRLNLLLCVPDFSLVRIMQLTYIGFWWRITARSILTLLLLIDIYQHDPPHDKQS